MKNWGFGFKGFNAELGRTRRENLNFVFGLKPWRSCYLGGEKILCAFASIGVYSRFKSLDPTITTSFYDVVALKNRIVVFCI